jgi:hypothetical protein
MDERTDVEEERQTDRQTSKTRSGGRLVKDLDKAQSVQGVCRPITRHQIRCESLAESHKIIWQRKVLRGKKAVIKGVGGVVVDSVADAVAPPVKGTQVANV